MGRPRDTITGIAIGPRAICCAQCYPESNLIGNISIQPFSATSNDFWASVTSAVKELVNNPEVKLNGEQVVSALPGEFAILKKVSVDADETDLEETIDWEFSQHIIGSREEYVYDYQPLAVAAGADLRRYLVVGYRQASVSRLNKILTAQKLNPIVVDLDVFALINVFELNYKERLADPALIVFTEEDKTKLILTQNGEFVDIEVVSHEAEGLEPDAYLEQISKGIEAVHLGNQGSDAAAVFLTGSTFSDDVFTSAILAKIPGSEVLYPFRSISCSAGMKEDDLRHYSPQLAIAVGLAMRGND
jgi:Tfp pilus assembly PilM family ATPase